MVLLSAWWIGPFVGNHQYMTDMKYGARPDGANDSFLDMFFPLTAPLDILVTTLAVIGFVACIARRHLAGTALGVIALCTVALVYLTQDSLPVIGLLWNPRLLPFIYLAALPADDGRRRRGRARGRQRVARPLARATTSAGSPARSPSPASASACSSCSGSCSRSCPATAGGCSTTPPSRSTRGVRSARRRPARTPRATAGRGTTSSATRAARSTPSTTTSCRRWPRSAATEGCGRVTWENNGDNGQYGTTMALMLLPHWTDGCIASMEGLFFEASGTTPYHFLTTAAMSKQSSNPVRELRYDNNDAAMGVPYLQALGVRYVMVRTDEAKRAAEAQPELTLLATSGPWEIYQVADSDDRRAARRAAGRRRRGAPGDQRERNLELGTSWFQHRDEWAAIPADDGPGRLAADPRRRRPEPPRARPQPRRRRPRHPRQAGRHRRAAASRSSPSPCRRSTVSDVVIDEQDLSFHVDQVGVPVLVKVSLLPELDGDGAEGPYRIAPNLMVVVPTERRLADVRPQLVGPRSSTPLTLLGIGLLVVLPHPRRRRPRRRRRSAGPPAARRAATTRSARHRRGRTAGRSRRAVVDDAARRGARGHGHEMTIRRPMPALRTARRSAH